MDHLDDPMLLTVKAIIGDPLPYGIEANRTMLEAIIQYAGEQGIIRQSFAIEELFLS
jgi:4,5-dihydroxyphthalate decarboxylase